MRQRSRWGAAAVFVLAMAGTVAAQGMGMGMGMMGKSMPEMRGIWNPVVGSGGVYNLTDKDGTKKMEFAIVGKENVQGSEGYWMEFSIETERGGMVAKNLMVMDNGDVRIARMIIQPSGQQPMELPVGMINMRHKPQPADVRKDAKMLGKESITVPAGTFVCDHLETNDGTNLWISADVPPYGLVKMVGKDGMTMVLAKVEKDATDKITGTPRMMNPMGMGMEGRPQQ